MVMNGIRARLRWGVIAVVALVTVACDLIGSPFPRFLAHTDRAVDLSGAIRAIQDGRPAADYTLRTISAAGGSFERSRVLLLVEPFDEANPDFGYRGRLLILDPDLNLLATAAPLNSLDTFGRPFAYGHDGRILVSNSILSPEGITEASLDFRGFEGPAIIDAERTIVFSLSPAGAFAGNRIAWSAYDSSGGEVPRAWANVASGSFPIIADAEGSGGYRILDAVRNEQGEVTFLLSEPSRQRFVAARVEIAAIIDRSLDSLVSGADAFPVAVPADRPLDVHIDVAGFFLRLRDGWFERHGWNPSGALSYQGKTRLFGDRFFDRAYTFLLGSAVTNRYMYRFDPNSRILTRYTQW